MRCRTARQLITLRLAGEAPPGDRRRLERHLEGCEGCRCEQAAYAALDHILHRLPMATPVPAALEGSVLRAIHAAATDGPQASRRRLGWWIGVPALAGAAALALALRATVSHDRPPATARPIGAVSLPRADTGPGTTGRWGDGSAKRPQRTVPSEPPPDLAARPDLFVDLPILRNLERLEHFEAIQTTTLGDEPGGGTSNG